MVFVGFVSGPLKPRRTIRISIASGTTAEPLYTSDVADFPLCFLASFEWKTWGWTAKQSVPYGVDTVPTNALPAPTTVRFAAMTSPGRAVYDHLTDRRVKGDVYYIVYYSIL